MTQTIAARAATGYSRTPLAEKGIAPAGRAYPSGAPAGLARRLLSRSHSQHGAQSWHGSCGDGAPRCGRAPGSGHAGRKNRAQQTTGFAEDVIRALGFVDITLCAADACGPDTNSCAENCADAIA